MIKYLNAYNDNFENFVMNNYGNVFLEISLLTFIYNLKMFIDFHIFYKHFSALK